MPKMKTHSGAKKRFKPLGNGNLKRKHAFKSHCLAKGIKSTKRKKKLTHTTLVHKTNAPTVRKLLTL